MRAAVVGAGSIGTAVAWALAGAGHDVVVVCRSERDAPRINEVGVRVTPPDRPESARRVRATTGAMDGWTADLIVIAVKTPDTEGAAARALSIAGDESVVLTLQNGWGNIETLRRTFPRNEVLAGVTYTSVTTIERARVRIDAFGETVLGTPDGPPPVAAALVDALQNAGMPVRTTADGPREIWRKLILNAALLAPSALVGCTMEELAAAPSLASLLDDLVDEAVAVARAEGVVLDAAERRADVQDVLVSAGPALTSMQYDVLAGRPTEIRAVNGSVVELGLRHGVPTPANQVMLALVEALPAADAAARRIASDT